MALTDKELFHLLWILALPAYSVLFANLFLLATERFFFSLESLVYFYLTVGIVFFAWFGWFVSIATTVGVLVCYVLLVRRNDVHLRTRRLASVIALTAAIAFAVSYKIVPLIIPAP
jgi:hypothetical protein